jgi:hypothetical protein|tara:strand:- start:641 stop:1486 length:846 start_codon:yes stop_codon:yes gene_type:complete
MTKTFTNEFDNFLDKLKTGENFAFNRFSDGELFMLQNQPLVLAENYFITGDKSMGGHYPVEEQKEFIPGTHKEQHKRLMKAFTFRKKGHYKGICSLDDIGPDTHKWLLDIHGPGDTEHLTFANVLINSNYRRYVDEMLPLYKERDIIYVVNELADLTELPFKVKKDFRVGTNCIVNNINTIDEVLEYMDKENAKDYLVLCSASALSNYIIHEGFKKFENNTFLDVGSNLNPYLGDKIQGWKVNRGYLTHYWLKSGSPYGDRVDYWHDDKNKPNQNTTPILA